MEEIVVSVSNFGPIEKGTVAVRPLTIFLGRNNTGKSYFAMLTHTFLESLFEFCIRYRLIPLGLLPRSEERRFIEQRRMLKSDWLKGTEKNELANEVLSLVRLHLPGKKSFELPKNVSEKIHDFAFRKFQEEFKEFFRGELERVFGCKISELCRHSKKLLKISFKLSRLKLEFECREDELNAKTSFSGVQRIVFRQDPKIKGVSLGVRLDERRMDRLELDRPVSVVFSSGLMERLQKEIRSPLFRRAVISVLVENVITRFLSAELNYSNYLPAARSGILAGHKALASGLLRQLRYIGLERMEFFPLSGTITDFLANILQIQRRKGDFPELASFLENEVAEGKIDIKEIERFAYPEIFYEFEKHELPLHRSSSMVSEVAPLVLYLKYVVTPNSTLTIEEPESHLHPSAQRKLAQLIAGLVNRNVRVILTSHSDYLLHQIQNLVLISDVEEHKLKELKYTEKDQLSANDVGAYLFSRTKLRTTRIKQIDLYDTTLKDSGFNEVVEELYGETVKIDRALKKNELRAHA